MMNKRTFCPVCNTEIDGPLEIHDEAECPNEQCGWIGSMRQVAFEQEEDLFEDENSEPEA